MLLKLALRVSYFLVAERTLDLRNVRERERERECVCVCLSCDLRYPNRIKNSNNRTAAVNNQGMVDERDLLAPVDIVVQGG